MAGRDYIRCKSCDCKLVYDGDDNIRDDLDATYGTCDLICPSCLDALEIRLAKLEQAPAIEPSQSVPVGYISEEDVYWFEQCGTVKISKRPDSIKTVPVFAEAPPATDETQQRALDFVRWIASLKTGGLIQARANDLLSMLEAGDEN